MTCANASLACQAPTRTDLAPVPGSPDSIRLVAGFHQDSFDPHQRARRLQPPQRLLLIVGGGHQLQWRRDAGEQLLQPPPVLLIRLRPPIPLLLGYRS
jgi:hypothetical protein